MLDRFRSHLTKILHLHESPHRTALAFAVGVGIAFSPTYGLHTLSVFFCAWAFRLNFLALMAGNLINNPWTTIPILALTFWVGFTILGETPPSLSWDDLSFVAFYEQVMPYLLPLIVGGIVLSLLGAIISYMGALYLITRYRAR